MYGGPPDFVAWGRRFLKEPEFKKRMKAFMDVLSTTDQAKLINLVFLELYHEKEKMKELNQGQLDPWKIFTLDDAFAPRPAAQYLVDGLIESKSLVITYGSPGVMKSLLLADLAVCVAGGLRWLASTGADDSVSFSTVQAPVMWIDADNGVRRTHERFEALARTHQVPPSAPLWYVSMPSPALDASDAYAIDTLAARIIRHQVGLLVIDNLSVISGKADENSDEMLTVMTNLRRLIETTGAALIVIHHQRKGSAGFQGRKGETLRGHSSINAALDLALLVGREEQASCISIRATKERGAPVKPFSAEFVFTHQPDSHELLSARFSGRPFRTEPDPSEENLGDEVVAIVAENRGINQSALRKLVKEACPSASDHRIRATINDLVRAGKLMCRSGDHNARSYEIPEASIE